MTMKYYVVDIEQIASMSVLVLAPDEATAEIIALDDAGPHSYWEDQEVYAGVPMEVTCVTDDDAKRLQKLYGGVFSAELGWCEVAALAEELKASDNPDQGQLSL